MSSEAAQGERRQVDKQLIIRPAAYKDASAIYRLKVDAFADSSLPYSIYQAPKSIRYIMWLILRGSGPTGNYFRVAEMAGRVIGYYHAVLMGTVWHLNYIAVEHHCRHKGLGRTLLRRFEEEGSRLPVCQFSLQAFESNASVVRWYLSEGYTEGSREDLYRVGLLPTGTDAPSYPVEISALERASARCQEWFWGFSKMRTTIGPGTVDVGLINGNVLNLMRVTGLDSESVVHSLARVFCGKRSVLLMRQPDCSPRFPIISMDRSIRMYKPKPCCSPIT
jgi:ribosomal protein S18 acetylase RimI-like enzyme